MDERICDGMYFANSMRRMKALLNNLELLEERLDAIIEDEE